MAVSRGSSLLVLVLAACMLAASQPTSAHAGHGHHHHRKLQQQPVAAAANAETDAAVAALLSTAQDVPPEVQHDEDAVAVAAAAAAAPILKRACGTHEGTRSHRAAAERRFQAKVQALQASGEDVTAAQAPVIPVYFHVLLLNNARGMVTQGQINAQIATMNAAYAGVFSFTLAKATWYTTNNTAMFTSGSGSSYEASIKQQLRQGTASSLNIYTWEPKDPSSGTLLGWATFPWDYSSSRQNDGVVLLYSTINNGASAGYNLGDTAVHETGHWAGLYHTFQGGCGSTNAATSGDYVADTPAVRVPNYKCTAVNSCADNQGADLINNFMDYTPDACMSSFTAGQKRRMLQAWSSYRSGK